MDVMNPCLKARGLLLASASTLLSQGRKAASASSTATSGTMTRYPSCLSMPSQERYSTENVLPRHGILAWNPLRSVGKVPTGEPSLSGEAECLSLHAYGSTHIQKEQEKKGGARMECSRTWPFLPCVNARAFLATSL